MVRKQDVCEVPGCTNVIDNYKRSLCGACASSNYYWAKRQKEDRGAMRARHQKLQFWSGRMDWLFQPHGPKLKARKGRN